VATRVIYLDIDDEITSAAARIRDADASRVAVVLPNGSRVATSRINFRLLSRDAMTHEKQLSIIAGDPATRALAASAGLPVFSTVAEYESAQLDPRATERADEPAAAVAAAVAESPAPADPVAPIIATAAAVGLAGAAGAAGAAALPGDTVRSPMPPVADGPFDRHALPEPLSGGAGVRPPTARPAIRWSARAPIIVGIAILALAVLVGGVGAYLLLPSATIVVTPRTETVGPIPVTVVADPTATEPDASSGVVPAKEISVDVTAADTFNATGKRVETTIATGAVRFDNLDPTSANTIAGGSIVSTGQGVKFRTDATITVRRADLVGLMIFPAHATVNVTAVAGGPEGNVEPNTIVIIPKGESTLFLKVVNPDATDGGSRQEFPKVVQKDVDAALKTLNAALDTAFQARLADPSIAPGGETVFPGTASLGLPVPSPDPATLVGQEVATFDLSLAATGTVIAVDPAPVQQIAETQLRAAVKPDHELVADSIKVTVGDPVVSGQTVSFPATATAQQVAIVDPAALKAMVLGKPVAAAKAILAPYGDVKVSTWPDWVGTVPTFDSRVELSVDQAVQVEAPSPSAPAP
jgi:hypothetical protein